MESYGEGILSDLEIRRAITAGEIEIDPFTPEHLNITSYDLTLGNEVRVYSNWVEGTPEDRRLYGDVAYANALQGENLEPTEYRVNANEEQATEAWNFDDRGFLLKPGIGYLMHTRERVRTDCYNPILDGKSSIGRLFIQVHATAGYGDPGFNGQYTLEVIVQHPVRVFPGMRICQIRFHTIAGRLGKLYDQVGHYTQESAKGAVASQAWRQFKREPTTGS